jgi:6-phosphofructokinase 1
MVEKKKIGILTSGGDCSGLNSIIRAAFIRSSELGYELIGIKRGAQGLVSRPYELITLSNENCGTEMLSISGSILKSNTNYLSGADSFKSTVMDAYLDIGFIGIVYIGGDGSATCMLQDFGDVDEFNFVFVPKTIDNDINYTDYSVGFLTAVESVVESIEKIIPTACSH